jgi:hypothetical protein
LPADGIIPRQVDEQFHHHTGSQSQTKSNLRHSPILPGLSLTEWIFLAPILTFDQLSNSPIVMLVEVLMDFTKNPSPHSQNLTFHPSPYCGIRHPRCVGHILWLPLLADFRGPQHQLNTVSAEIDNIAGS